MLILSEQSLFLRTVLYLCAMFKRKPKKKKDEKLTTYTAKEELANSLSHGIALLLSILGTINLVVEASLHGNTLNLVSVNIFGGSLIILFAASTVYHAVYNTELKHLCRIVDHSAIYILIAGTYTPVALVLLPPAWGWTLFGINWGLALIGVTFKIFFTGKFDKLSTAVYLMMGWLAVVAGKFIIELDWQIIALILGGGAFYTGGVVFYRMEKMRYHHAIWHLFVMAGAACHFFLVYLYTIPGPGKG